MTPRTSQRFVIAMSAKADISEALAIDVAAMPDIDDLDVSRAVIDLVDDPDISDP